MKTRWKVLITIGAFVLFLLAIVGTVLLVKEAFVMPFMGNRVAVIPIKGDITLEGCGSSIFGTYQCARVSTIKKSLREADGDPTVRAVVLDINSGGGSVVASRELMRAIKNTSKPVVAWIGEAGASGAYYAATGADRIIADRDSLTGSIGVIMVVRHYYGLYQKLGINVTVIKAGKGKDIGSPYREMTEEEKEELKEMLNQIYHDFVSDVAKNRNLSFSYVENISDGTIYLGSKAKELGLIDDIGGIDDAIHLAAELGGIEGEPVVKGEAREEISILDLFTRGVRLKWAE
ncbi:MAG TPA: signal peptide peptidase SppA [Candidatus Altiarchaeales archaeon]|nr:signal peptide peptidase SppA [Candidatus Altiarchaeales archaeon]